MLRLKARPKAPVEVKNSCVPLRPHRDARARHSAREVGVGGVGDRGGAKY